MDSKTPLAAAKAIETYINAIAYGYDADSLSFADKSLVEQIKRGITDARLDIRDYEVADTRAEQLRLQQAVHARLHSLQDDILKASQTGMFSAIEVAHISAMIEQLISNID